MSKEEEWMVVARFTAGTKSRYLWSILIQVGVTGYLFIRFFHDVAWFGWMSDTAALIGGGLVPIYQVVLIRKLIQENDSSKTSKGNL